MICSFCPVRLLTLTFFTLDGFVWDAVLFWLLFLDGIAVFVGAVVVLTDGFWVAAVPGVADGLLENDGFFEIVGCSGNGVCVTPGDGD